MLACDANLAHIVCLVHAGTLLIPQEPFELLVRRSISKLLQPAMTCKDLVYDELLKIAEAACPRDLGRFPVLQRRLAAAVLDFIQVRGCMND